MIDKTPASKDTYDFLVGAAALGVSFFAGSVLNRIFTLAKKNESQDKYRIEIQQLQESLQTLREQADLQQAINEIQKALNSLYGLRINNKEGMKRGKLEEEITAKLSEQADLTFQLEELLNYKSDSYFTGTDDVKELIQLQNEAISRLSLLLDEATILEEQGIEIIEKNSRRIQKSESKKLNLTMGVFFKNEGKADSEVSEKSFNDNLAKLPSLENWASMK